MGVLKMSDNKHDREPNPIPWLPHPEDLGAFLGKMIVRIPLYLLFYYLIVKPVFVYWWLKLHGNL